MKHKIQRLRGMAGGTDVLWLILVVIVVLIAIGRL